MATFEERANLAAWQIYEEIGLSKHSVERVAEIIEEKIQEQEAIDNERIAELEREKASLILEVHKKNKRIANLVKWKNRYEKE